ncbi:MAG TPA: hypothetical protein VGN26_11015 [Armatimonadota bacterium]|jgi:hypothetical protein
MPDSRQAWDRIAESLRAYLALCKLQTRVPMDSPALSDLVHKKEEALPALLSELDALSAVPTPPEVVFLGEEVRRYERHLEARLREDLDRVRRELGSLARGRKVVHAYGRSGVPTNSFFLDRRE